MQQIHSDWHKRKHLDGQRQTALVTKKRRIIFIFDTCIKNDEIIDNIYLSIKFVLAIYSSETVFSWTSLIKFILNRDYNRFSINRCDEKV